MGRLRTASDIGHPPDQFLLEQAIKDRALRGLSRGMSRLYGLVETEVADDLIDFDDDVLGDLGLHRLAIDHLDKGDALVIGLRDRHLAEYLELVGDNDTY